MNKHKSLKSLMVSSALSIVLACASIMSASAQSFQRLVVDVPFAFSARGQMLPAGRYVVERPSPITGTLFIASADGSNDGVVSLINSAESTMPPDEPELIFHRYGSTYFLSEVWTGVDNVGYSLPKSKAERTAERNQATQGRNTGTAVSSTHSNVVIAAVSR